MTSALTLPSLTFEKVVTFADVRDAVWYRWRRTKIKGAAFSWIVASFVGAFAGHKVSPEISFWIWLPIMLVISPGLVTLTHWFLIRQLSQRMFKRAEAAGPEKWIVNGEGIDVESSLGTVHLKWSSIRGYADTARLILLQLARTSIPIPRACLTADQEHVLRQLFDAKGLHAVGGPQFNSGSFN